MSVANSKRIASALTVLSKSIKILPDPTDDMDDVFATPLIRLNVPSRTDVTSCSIMRASAPGHVKLTDNEGKVLDGLSLNGNNGTSEIPTIVNIRKIKIVGKDESFTLLFYGHLVVKIIYSQIVIYSFINSLIPSCIKNNKLRERKTD